MARYILGLFLCTTIVIFVYMYIKGAIRRMFGVIPKHKKSEQSQVIYNKNGIVVQKGEHSE